MAPFVGGQKIRVRGLVNAAQHNGKFGYVNMGLTQKAAEDRIGVKLEDGTVLSVKPANLEEIVQPTASAADEPTQRTLKKDHALLHEFNGSPDPDVLALYYHFKDRAFDCFNAREYHSQMVSYYKAGYIVKLVVPRHIGPDEHFLVGLQHKDPDQNTLCEVAFNCGRSFTGISMLVKKRCFVCHKPGAPRSQACQVACFCAGECEVRGREMYGKLWELIDASSMVVEKESVQLLD